MLSTERLPRLRTISVNRISRNDFSSLLFNEKDHEEHRDPKKECFMCRQANVYIKPIGMQQERRVARRHPPLLTRTQIEELGQKKNLTKKEARKLLQSYFPEIKNVKYFQLHKYHSCCYDPKHLNLCKNHITALQHEREEHPNHQFYKQETDEDHYKAYERDDGYQNRVSFVRIKIEPTKGIPTRFLAPAVLPESLADMLIKQVNRLENKKKPPSFGPPPANVVQQQNLTILKQPYDNAISAVSEHLTTLGSEDDDDDDDDDDNYNNSDNDSNEDNYHPNTTDSGIRGFNGNFMGRSQINYEKKLQAKQEKQKEKSLKISTNDHVIVENFEDLNDFFVNENESTTIEQTVQPIKKKKRKKKRKPRTNHTHDKPKLNHWEIMALDQSKKDTCGCRHHVTRLEANHIVYDWCRCKDHQNKELKEKQKSTPTPEKPQQITPPPKTPKVETKTIGINATEPSTTELALAYDSSAIDYDVIQEAIYFRTSSGRLVKPEITNSFSYDNLTSTTDLNRHKILPNKPQVLYMTVKGQLQPLEDDGNRQQKSRLSPIGSTTSSNQGSLLNSQRLINARVPSTNNRTNEVIRVTQKSTPPMTTTGDLYGDDVEDESTERMSPKSIPERPMNTPVQLPRIPMSQQKSSKPTYINRKPTPNFENQSSIIETRRWFDQPLGDQNLLPVHDGRYGLIAGTSTDEYLLNTQLPDNDYIEYDSRVCITLFLNCSFNYRRNYVVEIL
ncbi:unnamed protein product [Rotaria sp. Silwood2]|nr:unnamed protein product [Rotaria sp. Silwood2]CAF4346358.1 unnamed protein product [Rotaria sp. Silwood2]CAF4350851.1 unnamed protein product [Rotaria sp. Silwood2]